MLRSLTRPVLRRSLRQPNLRTFQTIIRPISLHIATLPLTNEHWSRIISTEVFMSQPPLVMRLGLAVASILLFADANLAKLPTLSTKSRLAQKGKKKSKSNGPEEAGRPVLWEGRGDPSKLNLSLGVGSEEGRPKPPFKFDKEDVSGTNPKIKVVDANGVKWNIKFDEEVHGEVAASRIVWACGYMVEESYFVRSGKVEGVTKLGRARKFIVAGGSFKDGMFEKRPKDVARRSINWTWDA